MIMTAFSCFTVALVAVAGVLHIVRIKGRFSPSSTLAAVSGITWIIAAFAIVAAMVDQATQHPDSMPPDALLFGVVAAAFALVHGLVAVVPEMAASAHSANTANATPPHPPESGQ